MPGTPEENTAVEITPGTRQHGNLTGYLAVWRMASDFALSSPDDFRAYCMLRKIPAIPPEELGHARDFAGCLTAEMILGASVTIRCGDAGPEALHTIGQIAAMILRLLQDEEAPPPP